MRKKLLLADDSVTIQKVVELTFPPDEFEVVTAGNGRLAVDKALTFLPDFLLCDVIMPQLDGYQVCEAFRAAPQLKDIPILLLNGAFEPYDEARARAVGALGNVSKPFDPPALVARVREILAGRAATRTGMPGPLEEPMSLDGLTPPIESEDDDPAAPFAAADLEPGLPDPSPFASEESQDYIYDESGTRPVTTTEISTGAREFAARSLALDAPVFADAAPDVLTGEDEPSPFSETLHGGLDDLQNIGPPSPATEIGAPEVNIDEPEPVDFGPDTPAPGLPRTLPPGAAPISGEEEFEPHDFEMPAGELGAENGPDVKTIKPFPNVVAPEPDPDPVSLEIPRPSPGPKEAMAASGFADLPDLSDDEPSRSAEQGTAAPTTSEEVAVPVDMVQQIAQRVISQVSERVIREIAWDVIPGLAEKLIQTEIERIKARAESEHD